MACACWGCGVGMVGWGLHFRIFYFAMWSRIYGRCLPKICVHWGLGSQIWFIIWYHIIDFWKFYLVLHLNVAWDLWWIHAMDFGGWAQVHTEGWVPKHDHYFYSLLLWVFLCHTCLQPPILDLAPTNTSIVHIIVNIHHHIKYIELLLFICGWYSNA